MLGIELATAAFLPAAFVALLAGVLSFLSPCVLPIVPPYLAYMTGVGVNGLKTRERSAVVPALFFVLGLSTVFLVMGFAASAFGRAFLQYQDILARVAGVMVVVMGLHFLHVIRIPLLDHEARLQSGQQGGGALGAYVLGLAFAFGWTPCIGPQLGMILSLAATGGELSRGTALLAVYALGLGIPFLLAAIFINRAIGLMNRIKPYLKTIERVMGALLVVVGVMLLTGAFSAFSFWLLEMFPALATLGGTAQPAQPARGRAAARRRPLAGSGPVARSRCGARPAPRTICGSAPATIALSLCPDPGKPDRTEAVTAVFP